MISEPVYIIGDVHGCFNTLIALIDKLPNKEKSRLVFIGDLVDRGKYSAHVVEFIKSEGYDCVKGNHEAVMVEALTSYEDKEGLMGQTRCKKLWKLNGGTQTLRSYYYRKNGTITIKEHLSWMKQLPNYLEYDILDENGKTLFVTHGFGLPYWKNKDTMALKLRNNRLIKMADTEKTRAHYCYEEGYMDYPVYNVFGHDAVDDVIITHSYAAIDTSCVYGRLPKEKQTRYLTALEWPSKKVFQQKFIG